MSNTAQPPIPKHLRDLAQWTTALASRVCAEPIALPDGPAPRDALWALGLTPLAWRPLADAGHPDAAAFLDDYRNTLAINLLRMPVAAQVRDRLTDAGVRCVLLKGGAFLVRYCPNDLGVRYAADFDLLVDAPDPVVRAVMGELGFEADETMPNVLNIHHARAFTFDAGPVVHHIDVHRTLGPLRGHDRLAAEAVSGATDYDGWLLPPPEVWTCAIALHRMRDGFGGDLRELIDLRCVVGDIDVSALVATAKRTQTLGALYGCLRQMAVWFPASEPAFDTELLAATAAELASWQLAAMDRIATAEAPLTPTVWNRSALIRRTLTLSAGTGALIPTAAWTTRYAVARARDALRAAWRVRGAEHDDEIPR